MAGERRLTIPAPVQLNSGRIVGIGTALFGVAFVVLLPFWAWLGDHDHRIWLWTALAGLVLGVAGLALLTRHRAAGRTR